MNNADLAEQFSAADTMEGIGVTSRPKPGGVAEMLEMLRVVTPRPERDQVAVKMAASSMHIDEIYAAQGTALGRFYGPKNVSSENPYLLGSSVSGTIVAVGSDVTKFQVGAEVVAIPSEHMEYASWASYRSGKIGIFAPEIRSIWAASIRAPAFAACDGLSAITIAALTSPSATSVRSAPTVPVAPRIRAEIIEKIRRIFIALVGIEGAAERMRIFIFQDTGAIR